MGTTGVHQYHNPCQRPDPGSQARTARFLLALQHLSRLTRSVRGVSLLARYIVADVELSNLRCLIVLHIFVLTCLSARYGPRPAAGYVGKVPHGGNFEFETVDGKAIRVAPLCDSSGQHADMLDLLFLATAYVRKTTLETTPLCEGFSPDVHGMTNNSCPPPPSRCRLEPKEPLPGSVHIPELGTMRSHVCVYVDLRHLSSWLRATTG